MLVSTDCTRCTEYRVEKMSIFLHFTRNGSQAIVRTEQESEITHLIRAHKPNSMPIPMRGGPRGCGVG